MIKQSIKKIKIEKKINDYNKKYIKPRRRTDIVYRLILITRNSIYQVLRRKIKSSSTMNI